MLKKITAFFLSVSLLCAQSVSPGDLIYNIKNDGTGSTAVGLTPATSTDILAFDGNGRLTRVPRSAFAPSGGAGTGSVTSVALALPSIFNVSGSPVTSSGTLTGTLTTQTANTIFAGPTTGSASSPTFRALVVADIPNLSSIYEPLIGTGTLALSKLATDPLARANHTGTQALASIADAGALAALNTVASAQITNGTIVDEDINASAAIAPSKLAASPNVISLLGAADYAAIRSQLGLGTLATQSATITDYLLVTTASTTYQTLTGVLGLAGFSSITGTLADGNIASAATWNAKQSALTFSTGLTNTTGTVTVNASQNISTLSNLTSNGFVKASGGTGALSVDTTVYEPLIGTGTLALAKLATDPLARANHTGTQLLSTISDAGTLAGLSAIASAQITNGTIVDGDINASAAIAPSKLAASPNVVSLLGAADYAAIRSQLGLGTLATQSATITDYLLVSTASTTYQPVAGVLGLAGFSSITGTLADGNIASSSSWNAKQSALTFSTGLTNTTGTVTVNASQSINTLSNLTSNGFVKTTGGTGALSVDTTAYEPLIGTGTLALAKLAVDPLARASHTGTQSLSSISDAGTLAGLSAVASAQITNGTIVNEDISASAAIEVTKISGLGTLATQSGTFSGTSSGTNTGDVSLAGTPDYITLSGQTITRGLVDLTTDITSSLPVANGGTGSTTASDARTALGLAIGTNVQAYSANLTTYAGIAPSSNIQSLLGAADYAAVKTLLTLNNVENTTLSTWVGTSNVTTLGTITSGVWQGSIVAPAYLGTGSSISTKYLRGDGTWQTISGGGDALTSGTLAQFAATSSEQLRGVLSDENGTGEFLTTNGSAASLTSFPTLNQNTTGSAATLTTPRNINGTAFDGSANITVTAAAGTLTGDTLASGVTSSSLTTLGTVTTGVWDATALVGTKVDAATTSARGTVELATDGETSASVVVQGNDTRLANAGKVEIGIAASDETSDNTASTTVPKVTFRMPHAMTLTGVRCSLTKAATGATFIVDIHESGTTIMSTNKLSVDAGETTSTTATTAAGITDASLADDAVIEVFIDQVGTTADNTGEGVKVWLIGTR